MVDILKRNKQKNVKYKSAKADRIFSLINGLILSIAVILVAYPLLFVLSASFSSTDAVMAGKVWIFPVEPTLTSYKAVFANKQIFSGYLNSTFYVLVGSFFSVALTLCAAYPLTRKELPGNRIFTSLFLFTMLFSGGLVPTYLVVQKLGLIDTRWALIIPNALGIWNLIVTRTYIKQNIPEELREVARIEGAGDFWFFLKVVIPLSSPIIAVMLLYYGVGIWNSYFDGLIYLNDQRLYPLQLILRNILILNQIDITMVKDVSVLARMQGLSEVLKYALIVVATAPFMAIYPFVQKYFVKGMMVGSLKG